MEKLWFKAKRYGWGWYPCSIDGWLATLAYAATFAAAETTFILRIQDHHTWYDILFFLLFIAAITGMLIRICYVKGEKPGWHWGGKNLPSA